ncbi:uncharacterized protein LOC132558226 [Ylistrum balloti]|uniref:uncharacterized protein LOC132558226 n=1 Tax=Ylistrum balloti TaxID=509963 RepID=UPI00290583F4|nr:uncharacterized protein LOC132558226 [Ylistrum balloti]
MEVSDIKKALRTHRMESIKSKIDFADISSYDIVPTPPKEPKPEANRLHRRHGIRAQKSYQAKYTTPPECETQKYGTEPGAGNGSGDFCRTRNTDLPWYCPSTSPRDTFYGKGETNIHKKDICNDLKSTSAGLQTNLSVKEVLNNNPIRYPVPGPRDQLVPSPFPINKNKLAPVVDPKKNPKSKTAHAIPRPAIAVHMPFDKQRENDTFTGQQITTPMPEATINTNPIRYPVPGPRDQLVPSPFPINKNKLAPVVDPKKNAKPKTARAGPCPVKAVHLPVYRDNTESSCILTQMFGDRDTDLTDSVIPVTKQRRPSRYPGSREQLLPNPFSINKACLPPIVKRGRVVAPMCG